MGIAIPMSVNSRLIRILPCQLRLGKRISPIRYSQERHGGTAVACLIQLPFLTRCGVTGYAAVLSGNGEWTCCGFEPDADELHSIETLRQELGFDPRLHSHDLTAKHDRDKLSAKRVLSILTANRFEREMGCIPISIGVSEERGNQNGLAKFLMEVRERLVLSLFAGRK